MTETAEKVHDLPAFSFGLWNECPKGVSVAWGARGIADNGVGFSLLPDRQTWIGDEEGRAAFSKLLNGGPLREANECCRRLREGWVPFKELDGEAFVEYWVECQEDRKLMELAQASGYADRGKLLYTHLRKEDEALNKFYEDEDARVAEHDRNPPPPPPPPSHCEEEDEDGNECGQKFTKIGKGEYDGCWAEDEAWVCENCGAWHSFDEEDDDWPKPPGTPILDMVSRIVGCQPAKMRSGEAETFTLYESDLLIIKGNTNASYGYVYLIAYPKG